MPDLFGLDQDGDGFTDFYTSSPDIGPSGWVVNFDACASSGSITRFDWEIEGVSASNRAACDGFSHTFAAEDTYQVSLTVSSASGASRRVTHQVVVQDRLIAAVGDGYASGEGNPDAAISKRVWDEMDTQQKGVEAAIIAHENAQDALNTAETVVAARELGDVERRDPRVNRSPISRPVLITTAA